MMVFAFMAAKPPLIKARSDFIARRGTMGMNLPLAVF
jgi:hypothetical protein